MLCGDYSLEGVRVLFVGGRTDDCELYRLVFGGCGAEVAVVGSARAALAAFDHVAPHILISDISLPDESGYDLIRRLRDRGTDTPAVAVSAFAHERDRSRALEAGFTAFVPKPVEPEWLVTMTAHILGLPQQAHPAER